MQVGLVFWPYLAWIMVLNLVVGWVGAPRLELGFRYRAIFC